MTTGRTAKNWYAKDHSLTTIHGGLGIWVAGGAPNHNVNIIKLIMPTYQEGEPSTPILLSNVYVIVRSSQGMLIQAVIGFGLQIVSVSFERMSRGFTTFWLVS